MIKTVSIKAIPFYSRKKVSIKICYSVHVVTSAPKLPVPVFEFHAAPFLVDHQAALSFQKTHKPGHADLGRNRQQHMDMIGAYFGFYDLHTFPPAQFRSIAPISNRFSS